MRDNRRRDGRGHVTPQPLIAVRDVECDARNLGGGSDHDDDYDRLHGDSKLIMPLHASAKSS